MEKLDKVIAGMEACNGVGDDCNSCPYAGEGEKCSGILWADILVVLRNVEPVVHARWEWKDLHGDGSLTLCCSKCLETDGARETAKRCPECGAHMDEEVAE